MWGPEDAVSHLCDCLCGVTCEAATVAAATARHQALHLAVLGLVLMTNAYRMEAENGVATAERHVACRALSQWMIWPSSMPDVQERNEKMA